MTAKARPRFACEHAASSGEHHGEKSNPASPRLAGFPQRRPPQRVNSPSFPTMRCTFPQPDGKAKARQFKTSGLSANASAEPRSSRQSARSPLPSWPCALFSRPASCPREWPPRRPFPQPIGSDKARRHSAGGLSVKASTRSAHLSKECVFVPSFQAMRAVFSAGFLPQSTAPPIPSAHRVRQSPPALAGGLSAKASTAPRPFGRRARRPCAPPPLRTWRQRGCAPAQRARSCGDRQSRPRGTARTPPRHR